MWTELRDWSNWFAEWLIVVILIVEYKYDKAKDDLRKTKRTKATKKTTTQPSGGSIVEETTETFEPTNGGENK